MILLITGGRSYSDIDHVRAVISALDPKLTLIVQGGAPGADSLAAAVALECGIPVRTYPADWLTHGRSAGPRRNQLMIDESKPDLIIAFPGGPGTADCLRRARAAGIPIQMEAR